MKKLRLLALLLAAVFMLSACASGNGGGSPSPTGSSTQEPLRIGYIAPIVLPYFDLVKQGCERFAEETGAEIEYHFGAAESGSQQDEDAAMTAMAAKGIRNFLVFPDDDVAANASFQELKDIGCNIVNYGGDTAKPTPVSFYVGQNKDEICRARAQYVVDALGGKGNIILAYQDSTDPNVAIARKAYNETFEAAGMKVIQELTDLNGAEMAQAKFNDAIAANYGNIDGILVYGLQVSIGLTYSLAEYYADNPDADHIFVFTLNDTQEALAALRAGNTNVTTYEPSEVAGYIACWLLARMRDGWTPKEGAYFLYVPEIYITMDNIDDYTSDAERISAELMARAEVELLEKPN